MLFCCVLGGTLALTGYRFVGLFTRRPDDTGDEFAPPAQWHGRGDVEARKQSQSPEPRSGRRTARAMTWIGAGVTAVAALLVLHAVRQGDAAEHHAHAHAASGFDLRDLGLHLTVALIAMVAVLAPAWALGRRRGHPEGLTTTKSGERLD